MTRGKGIAGAGLRRGMAMLLLALLAGLALRDDVYAARTISVEDHLQISVLGAPEFTRLVRVRSDGTVAYPYITEIPVVGMTTTEMQTLLVTILRRYMDNPVVVIEMPEVYTIRVQVLGQVREPGMIQVPIGTDVQSAISLAGGPADHADPSRVHILRPTGTDSTGQPMWQKIDSNLPEFLASGDIKELPKLAENDIVIVPSITNDTSVMLVGWVNKPGNYVPYPDSNVLNMILAAGGFSPNADRSNIRHLYEVGPGQYAEHRLDIEQMIDKGEIAQIPPVGGGDVIVVDLYDPFFTWDRMLELLRDISIIAGAYLIYLRIDKIQN